MAQINDKILFTGGLNTDDGLRSLPEGDYPDAVNNRIHVTEKSNDGSSENPRGNVLISHSLPAGQNQTIGSYEDKNKQRIVYLNWNSNGDHGIYQFFWNTGVIETIKEDPVFGFSRTSKITGISIVEALTGDLLYWTDNNQRPRKINIDKANDTNKKRKYELFIKINSSTTTTITPPSGAPITWTIIDPNAGNTNYTLEDAIKYYISQIPASALAVADFHTCYQFFEVEFKSTGAWTISISGSGGANYSVPSNFYPSPMKEDFIDAIKYPTICQPGVSVLQDTDVNLNLIQNKIFQFRTRIVFDDNEKSVLSPYSLIPNLPIACGANQTQTSFNYIEVDFNDPRLTDPSYLSIIKRVELYVRERNSGKVKYINALDKWQWLLYDAKYDFYNDGIYLAIDDALSVKNYDSLPLLAKSQEFATNRIFYGGITEGYDPVCVDAKINLSYEQDPTPQVFSFSGNLQILNFFASSGSYNANQPIHDEGNGPVFGGFGTAVTGNASGIDTDYKQTIPLGGFTFYLAGTNYYATSRQPAFSGLTQNAEGVMDSSTASKRNAIRGQITSGGVGSTFSFQGVPPGKYILRIASHLITQSDLASSSLTWQKTSTYSVSVAGHKKNEAEIEITSSGQLYVNGVLQAGNVLPTSYVADLTDPAPLTSTIGIAGYSTGADISPTPATAAGLLGDTRIDLSRITIQYPTNFGSFVPFLTIPAWASYVTEYTNGNTYTDHNGFFWWATRRYVSPGAAGPDVLSQTVLGIGTNSLSKYDTTGAAWSPSNAKGTHLIIMRIQSSGVFDDVRTVLTGTIQYNGQFISGVNVISSRGQFDETDTTGVFNIVIYGDTKTFLSTGLNTRNDSVYFGSDGSCLITFNPATVSYAAAIAANTGTAPPYNYALQYTVSGITITGIAGQQAIAGLKRGGEYSIGFVYYDNAIRDNGVSTSKELDLKIPFYTEYIPNTTTIVGQSRPIVEVEANHLPPSWATHYQIVRTLNGNQGKYLQWTAKSITYVDNDGNPINFSQATQIKVDLEGVLCFADQNVDSKVSYEFEEGDRLVLIKNGSTGTFYNQYYDFKIKGSKTGALLILYIENLTSAGVIPAGSLFEIYNPTKKQEQELYYEIGECYEIGNPGTANAYHKGTQDQIVTSGVSTTPLKVTLTTGDTWYRLRSIPYDSTNTIGNPCNNQRSWFIEDASINDFFDSEDQSIGRFHIYNKDLGERYRPSAIRFSSVLIEETKVNGLNSFEGLNEKVLPLEYGLIEKLIVAKDVLCSIHHNSEFVSMYLGKEVLEDNALQSLVAVSNKVIQQSYQYQGGLGTQNPESIVIDEDNAVYGYDGSKGMVWVREVNGLIPISEIKMRTYFRDRAALIAQNGGGFVYGAYDNRFGQYMISFEAVPNVTADTIAYNNRKKRWESRYTIYPEYYGGARNNVLVAFKDGELWRFNSNTYNNFFGLQYNRSLTAVARMAPSDMKNFLYISTESSHAWGTAPQGITTLEGQVSELNKSDFELVEHVYRADLLRDINTPNISDPLIFGDNLLSSILKVEMEDSETGYSTLYAVNIYSIISNPTNR